MALALRPIEAADVPEAGRICHDAFKAIATEHNYPPDFPNPEIAIGLLSELSVDPGFYGIVAEADGRIVGSNFLDERSRSGRLEGRTAAKSMSSRLHLRGDDRAGNDRTEAPP